MNNILIQKNKNILFSKEISLEYNEQFINKIKNSNNSFCFAYVKINEKKNYLMILLVHCRFKQKIL